MQEEEDTQEMAILKAVKVWLTKQILGYDGRTRFAKEQWHVSYDFTDHKNAMSSIEDKWVGFKGIMWNMVQNGKTVVKMEIWVDKNEDGKQNGPWVKVDENTDSGGWGNREENVGEHQTR